MTTPHTPPPANRATRNQTKTVHTFLPASLDLRELNVALTGVAGSSAIQKAVCQLYSYLICRSVFSRRDDAYDPQRYVQVHYSVLRPLLGNQYVQIIQHLLDTNLLERLDVNPATGEVYEDGYYYHNDVSGQAKSYRIPAQLMGTEKAYRIAKEPVTPARLRQLRELAAPKTAVKTDQWRDYIREQMSHIVLVDTPECRAAIDQLFAASSVRMEAEMYLTAFNYSPFHYSSIDEFGHRVHSQVVNSPAVLRQFMRFVRFENDLQNELVEIDIVNSQPAIFASITPALIKRFAPECWAAIPLFRAVQDDENWQLYQAHCFNNTIYEYLASESTKAYGERLLKPVTRGQAKTVYFVAAFSDYQKLERENLDWWTLQLDQAILYQASEVEIEKLQQMVDTLRAYQLFKRLFPTAHQLFADIKALDWSAFNPGQPHSNNCLLAQRIESGLVYGVLVKSLVEGGVEQLITVHDAIFVRRKQKDQARKIVMTELRKLKLKMQLKTKTVTSPPNQSEMPVSTARKSDKPMKRFLIFAYPDYYPGGGAADVAISVDTIEQVQQWLDSYEERRDHVDVLDLENRRWLCEGEPVDQPHTAWAALLNQ